MNLANRSLQLIGLVTVALIIIYWSELMSLWKNRGNLSKVNQIVQAYREGADQ